MNCTDDKRNLIMTLIMTPTMANFRGNVHGGDLMSFFDKVAYACSVRYSSEQTVTVAVDHIFFKEPIYVNDLVTCQARVNYVGKTSMEVGIRVESQNLVTKAVRHTNTCYFTMVAVDEHGKTIPVPPFTPEAGIDKKRYDEAVARRAERVTYYKEHYKKKAG